MKTCIKSIAIAFISAGLAMGATAQTTRSGYFLSDYNFRYEMNPAYGNNRNYVAIPVLDNMNIAMQGSIGLDAILYNVDGQTTTFLNPNVSVEDVMSKISSNNKLGADIKLNLLSGGWASWGGYNNISVNVRSSLGLSIPGDLFSLLKEGVRNKQYNVGRFAAFANAYAEIALNHSHQITPEWRVGGGLKVLIGAANFSANIEKGDLYLGEDSWKIEAEGQMNANIKGFSYETTYDENIGRDYVSGMNIDNTGLNGFGLAFDLGAVYTPAALPDWEFSMAFTDLGFIHWNNNVVASTDGLQVVNTDDYSFNVDNDNTFDQLRDDITKIYELKDLGDLGGRTTGLGATMNIGAVYTLPAYRPLTFGLLNTTRIQGKFSWTDFRLSANIAPCKVFEAGVNLSVGTFGAGFGWMGILHCPGFNFFIGMDRTLGKLAKQGIPINANASVNLGMSVQF